MSEGLITRIGQWLDRKWESGATEAQVEQLAGKLGALKLEVDQTIQRMAEHHDLIASLETKVLAAKSLDGDALNKEVTDLKTRIERIEVGTGMYRKIDPTKAPVAKTAFQM